MRFRSIRRFGPAPATLLAVALGSACSCGDEDEKMAPPPPPPPPSVPPAVRVSITPSPEPRLDADAIRAANAERATRLDGAPDAWVRAFQPPRGASRLRNAEFEEANGVGVVRITNVQGRVIDPDPERAVVVPGGPPLPPMASPEALEAAKLPVRINLRIDTAEDAPPAYTAPVPDAIRVLSHDCQDALANTIQVGETVVQEADHCDAQLELTAHEVGLYLADLVIEVDGGEVLHRLLVVGTVSPSHLHPSPEEGL